MPLPEFMIGFLGSFCVVTDCTQENLKKAYDEYKDQTEKLRTGSVRRAGRGGEWAWDGG